MLDRRSVTGGEINDLTEVFHGDCSIERLFRSIRLSVDRKTPNRPIRSNGSTSPFDTGEVHTWVDNENREPFGRYHRDE